MISAELTSSPRSARIMPKTVFTNRSERESQDADPGTLKEEDVVATVGDVAVSSIKEA